MRFASAVVLAATLSRQRWQLRTGARSIRRWAIRRGDAGDVHRYGFPRSDLHVTVDGVTLLPAFALGGWLAFKAEGDRPW